MCDWEEEEDNRDWNSSCGNIPGGNNPQSHLREKEKGKFISKINPMRKYRVPEAAHAMSIKASLYSVARSVRNVH